MPEVTALGMIETFGLVSAIEAADAGLKAAHVHLLGTDYVRGGLVMVRFEGEVAAVNSAVDAGTAAAMRVGQVFSSHVIPRAMPEVFCMLASDVSVGPAKRHQGGCAACGGCEGGRREIAAIQKAKQNLLKKENSKSELGKKTDVQMQIPDMETLKKMKVVDLRKLVRKIPNFPLNSNDIRYSNKEMLLNTIRDYQSQTDQ